MVPTFIFGDFPNLEPMMLHHYYPFQDGISALHNDVDAMQQRLQRLTWEMGHSMGCSKCRWCCRFLGHGMFTLPPIIMIIMEVKNASQRSISMDPGDDWRWMQSCRRLVVVFEG